jgi:hypothetical protein
MNITFLTYLSRSGSTLLASKLDKYSEIGVSIEENWEDGILKGKVKLNCEEDLDQYLMNISASKKFKFWHIDSLELKKDLLKLSFPISYKDVLAAIYKQFFGNDEIKYFIHKKGAYFMHYKKVLRIFPDAKILFIDRDPRGIYNSQKKSIDSITGKCMRSNPVRFAIYYKKSRLVVNRILNKPFFLKTSYEKLITDEKDELSRILKFIGLKRISTINQSNDYFNKIPETQRHLHGNIKKDKIVKQRMQGWQKELDDCDVAFLQCVLKKEIKELDYVIKNIQTNCKLEFYKHVLIFSLKYPLSYLKTRIQIILGIL